MSLTGNYAGTPLFMPPEQIVNFKYVKPVSDVWSFAATPSRPAGAVWRSALRLGSPDGDAALSRDGASEKWAAVLSRQWMDANPEAVGTLYIDGHVRDYHGSKTKLPRKYVSHQRLCLRGTTDYRVNDLTGKPF